LAGTAGQVSVWHSSPGRICSYGGSDPRCGLLERKVVDTIRPLPCRPRLGPQHWLESFLSERCVLSKSPIPSPWCLGLVSPLYS